MSGGMCVDRDGDVFVFFFKQKTAYEMRISDWSSDVCSSDLQTPQLCVGNGVVFHRIGITQLQGRGIVAEKAFVMLRYAGDGCGPEIGRASCRERVCQYV